MRVYIYIYIYIYLFIFIFVFILFFIYLSTLCTAARYRLWIIADIPGGPIVEPYLHALRAVDVDT